MVGRISMVYGPDNVSGSFIRNVIGWKSILMNAEERKKRPVFTGVIKYFPDAIMEISRVSLAGNKQHHPDKPLHWDRSKSTDDYDALARHLIDAGTIDDDGIRHTAKVAWRALACLQKEIENERSH